MIAGKCPCARCEDSLGRRGISPRILHFVSRLKWTVSFTTRPVCSVYRTATKFRSQMTIHYHIFVCRVKILIFSMNRSFWQNYFSDDERFPDPEVPSRWWYSKFPYSFLNTLPLEHLLRDHAVLRYLLYDFHPHFCLQLVSSPPFHLTKSLYSFNFSPIFATYPECLVLSILSSW